MVSVVFLGHRSAVVLAFMPLLVIIKIYGYCPEGNERQEQEKKKNVCRVVGEAWVGQEEKVHMVKKLYSVSVAGCTGQKK